MLHLFCCKRLRIDFEMGKSQYIKIGKVFKREGFNILPSYTDLAAFHKEIVPSVSVLPAPFEGVKFELSSDV